MCNADAEFPSPFMPPRSLVFRFAFTSAMSAEPDPSPPTSPKPAIRKYTSRLINVAPPSNNALPDPSNEPSPRPPVATAVLSPYFSNTAGSGGNTYRASPTVAAPAQQPTGSRYTYPRVANEPPDESLSHGKGAGVFPAAIQVPEELGTPIPQNSFAIPMTGTNVSNAVRCSASCSLRVK
jgi:hypothetical protein